MGQEGASYLPILINEVNPGEGGGSRREGELDKGKGPANQAGTPQPPPGHEKDPLYAALLGGKIDDAIGGAERETELNTLDEPLSATMVLLSILDRLSLLMSLLNLIHHYFE